MPNAVDQDCTTLYYDTTSVDVNKLT